MRTGGTRGVGFQTAARRGVVDAMGAPNRAGRAASAPATRASEGVLDGIGVHRACAREDLVAPASKAIPCAFRATRSTA